MAEEDEMKAKLLAELKAQLSGEIKEELKKEFSESMRPARKPKAEKEKKPDVPDTEVKENSAVISQLGNIPVPKHILKALGWGKGDVIDLKIENGKLLGERVGHTSVIPKQKAKSAEGAGGGQAGTGEGKTESAAMSGIMKYIEFEFSEKQVMGKMRQYLEEASKLYDNGNAADGLNVLNMIEAIELKVEEPDRGKMRLTAVKFLVDMIAKHPEAMETQMPRAVEITTKIGTRYLQERAYGFIAAAYKQIPGAEDGFEQVLEILFGLLSKYHVTELYAIISLLETIIKLLQGTSSPHVAQIVEYIKEKFNKIDDNDYKIRFIKMLTSLEAFNDARDLGKEFKAQTTEDSAEHRAALDALRENRDTQKAFFEKHPELQPETMEEDLDADLDEELKKKPKKKPKEEEGPKEQGEASEQQQEEKPGEESKPLLDHVAAVPRLDEEEEAEENERVIDTREIKEAPEKPDEISGEESKPLPDRVAAVPEPDEGEKDEESERLADALETEETPEKSDEVSSEESKPLPDHVAAVPGSEEGEEAKENERATNARETKEAPTKQPIDILMVDDEEEADLDDDDLENEKGESPEGD